MLYHFNDQYRIKQKLLKDTDKNNDGSKQGYFGTYFEHDKPSIFERQNSNLSRRASNFNKRSSQVMNNMPSINDGCSLTSIQSERHDVIDEEEEEQHSKIHEEKQQDIILEEKQHSRVQEEQLHSRIQDEQQHSKIEELQYTKIDNHQLHIPVENVITWVEELSIDTEEDEKVNDVEKHVNSDSKIPISKRQIKQSAKKIMSIAPSSNNSK